MSPNNAPSDLSFALVRSMIGAVRSGFVVLYVSSIAAGGLTACDPGAECTSSSECEGDLVCIDQRCLDVGAMDGSTGDAAGGCDGGLARCAAGCVDTNVDRAHCGGCNRSCGAMQECVDGTCLGECAPSESRCGVSCVDTESDAAHCGMCDRACAATEECVAGSCQPLCVPTEPPIEVCDGLDNDCDGAGDPSGCGEGLVAWYRFDSSDAAAIDYSGRGNHGSFENTAARDPAGVQGGALRLDGMRASEVRVPDSPDFAFSTEFTAEAWIFLDACVAPGSDHNTVLAIEASVLFAFNAACRVSNFLYTAGAWRNDQPVATVPVGRWAHYAMSWDGATMTSYLDGNPLSAGTPFGGMIHDPMLDLHIGSRIDCGCTQAFLGRLDEVKLWNVHRDQREVCEDAGGTFDDVLNSCRL